MGTRKRLYTVNVPFEEYEDDETEVQNRRLEILNESAAAEATIRRRSAASLDPTLIQKKITAKNAFNYLFIDQMAAMVKRSDSETNFPMASLTLDASVKVYGCRVDAVHNEAMKIAGLFRNVQEENPNVDKAQKKRKIKKTFIAPPHMLNAKSECEALMDSRPPLNILSKIADGSSLLTKVPKYNDECSLAVTSDVPCWPFDNETNNDSQAAEREKFDPAELIECFNSIDILLEDQLCSAVSAIQFGKDLEDDHSELELTKDVAYEFDADASVINLSQEEATEKTKAELDMPCTGFDSGDEIAVSREPFKNPQLATLSEMQQQLSADDKEYTLFDEKLFNAWAGPTYWKVRPTRLASENKENEEPTASKRTQRRQVKPELDLFQIDPESLQKELQTSDKTCVAKSTLYRWRNKNNTHLLTDDYKYSPKQLFTLFNMPLSTIDKPVKEVSILEDVIQDNDENDAPVEELQYCSIVMDEEEADEGDNIDKSVNQVPAFVAENMPAAPTEVLHIATQPFQQKTYVDIRHLKTCIWNVLADTTDVTDDTRYVTAPTFSNLLKICDSKLPGKVKGCLNAPLVLNALLHLTNEKSLILKQNVPGSDFDILQ